GAPSAHIFAAPEFRKRSRRARRRDRAGGGCCQQTESRDPDTPHWCLLFLSFTSWPRMLLPEPTQSRSLPCATRMPSLVLLFALLALLCAVLLAGGAFAGRALLASLG